MLLSGTISIPATPSKAIKCNRYVVMHVLERRTSQRWVSVYVCFLCCCVTFEVSQNTIQRAQTRFVCGTQTEYTAPFHSMRSTRKVCVGNIHVNCMAKTLLKIQVQYAFLPSNFNAQLHTIGCTIKIDAQQVLPQLADAQLKICAIKYRTTENWISSSAFDMTKLLAIHIRSANNKMGEKKESKKNPFRCQWSSWKTVKRYLDQRVKMVKNEKTAKSCVSNSLVDDYAFEFPASFKLKHSRFFRFLFSLASLI